MAGVAEISARRDVREHLVIAIHEVRDADHRSTGPFGVLPAMTVEAAVRPQRKLIAIDRMWNDWRLLRVVSHLALVVGDGTSQRRRWNLLHRLRATGHARDDVRGTVRRKRSDGKDERPAQRGASKGLAQGAQAGTILTAHFLKSVCFEIGSVASSVALLMS